MKIKLLFSALMLVTTLGFAQTFTDANGLNYNVLTTNPNTVEVTGGTVVNPLTIPSTVLDNGIIYTVTTIGNQAFRNKGVTEVVLPNSITTLAFRAFRDNGNLTSITLPESATNVGGEAFFNGGLNEIIALGTTPASIGNSSFGTRSTINVTVPDGLEETYVSGGWTGFATMNGDIPIGGFLTEGDLRYEVLSNINNTVEVNNRVGTEQNITVPETITAAATGVTYTVTEVGFRALRNTDITSITLPASITTIANEAFDNTTLLTSFTVLATAPPTIGNNAFEDRSIISLTVPNGLEDDYIAGGWTGFGVVNGEIPVGSNFTSGDLSYKVLSNATVEVRARISTEQNIVVPETVTSDLTGTTYNVIAIGFRAFRNADIISVAMPSSVVTIGQQAFENMLDLTTIDIQATIPPTIITNTFGDRSSVDLVVPNGLEDDYITAGWIDFRTINGEIPVGSNFTSGDLSYKVLSSNTVEVIARVGTEQNIVVPETVTGDITSTIYTVTAIGIRAFRNTDIISIAMPSTITVIGTNAFDNADSLTAVSVLATLPPTIESNSFENRNQKTLIIPNGSEAAYLASPEWGGFFSVNGVPTVGINFSDNGISYSIIGANPNILQVRSGPSNGDLVIPATVNKLNIAFSVTTIREDAFRFKNLESVIFPETLVSIDTEAFQNNNIKTLAFPATLETIGARAFRNNPLLTTVSSQAIVPPTIANSSIENRDAIDLTVPEGTIDTYVSAGWTGFKTINGIVPVSGSFIDGDLQYTITSKNPNRVEVRSRVTTTQDIVIPNNAFSVLNNESYTVKSVINNAFRGTDITSVVMTNNITLIGIAAFRDCQLTSVTLSNNLVTIKNDAFRSNQIENINLPNSLTTLESFAFRSNALTFVLLPTGITTVERNTFRGNDIIAINIPSNITTIADNAFSDNPIGFIAAEGETPATIDATSFGDRSAISLTIPTGQTVADAYTAAGWTGFASTNGGFNIGATFVIGDLIYEVIEVNPNKLTVAGAQGNVENLTIPTTATDNLTGAVFDVTAIKTEAF